MGHKFKSVNRVLVGETIDMCKRYAMERGWRRATEFVVPVYAIDDDGEVVKFAVSPAACVGLRIQVLYIGPGRIGGELMDVCRYGMMTFADARIVE